MNTHLTPFQFGAYEVRTLLVDGQPWFVASDVCAVLAFGNPRQAVESHVDSDDVQKLDVTDKLGRRQRTNHVNESGLYALIFGSTKDTAKRFKRWVTHDVLPAIRKTGGYESGQRQAPNMDHLSRLDILHMAMESEQERLQLVQEKSELEHRIEEAAPRLAFARQVEIAQDAISVAKAAKIMGTGQRRLFAFLRHIGWVSRRNEPYQCKIEAGYLDVKLGNWEHPEHGLQQSVTTLITGKGMARLHGVWHQRLQHSAEYRRRA